MPNYRRADIPGGTYFFTLVTCRRQKILCHDNIRAALRDAIVTTRTKFPFTIDAMVLLPDHLHTIWTMPENDRAYSVRWSMIKRLVTQAVGAHGAPYVLPPDGVIDAHGAPYGDGGDAGRIVDAHGVPYRDGRDDGVVGCAARTDINAGRDDGFVGCAARTEINAGRGDGVVGCAARTDINAGRDDGVVGCAARTDINAGRDDGFVGCAARTDINAGEGDGFVGCAARTDINAGRDDGFVGCAARADINAGEGDGFVGCAARADINPGGDNGVVGCAVRTGLSHGSGMSASRLKRREGAIWQRRFWEHQVRDPDDLNRCINYLHWNPVKHGYVKQVADWPYSTFHRFVHEGVYPPDWGGQGVDDANVFGE